MTKPSQLSIQDFSYSLPDEKIALHPLAQRDASRLLIYKQGQLQEDLFSNISHHLPQRTLLVFNNTRVINARLRFKKTTGANIEIFCLEPLGEVAAYSTIMSATAQVRWKCLVGGAAKWKEETLVKTISIEGQTVEIKALKMGRLNEAYDIQLSWTPSSHSFAAVLEAAGDTPLPPYIKRDTDTTDTSRYQTIFAKEAGSVAAPTAGLHYTEAIFEKLAKKEINRTFITLHVGAGTFKPVKATQMQDHDMHAEYIDVHRDSIEDLRNNIGHIAAVGTTSLRTLETLYWLGAKIFLNPAIDKLFISQWEVYEAPLADCKIDATDALDALLLWMQRNQTNNIFAQTQILIAPGYRFRMVNILTTNFHQPQSTLLLLVAAAIGEEWRRMYDYALQHDFRFLSYGDGNLIFLD